jgi:hypothetical protein
MLSILSPAFFFDGLTLPAATISTAKLSICQRTVGFPLCRNRGDSEVRSFQHQPLKLPGERGHRREALPHSDQVRAVGLQGWVADPYGLDVVLPILDLGQEQAYSAVGFGRIVVRIAILAGWLLASTVIASVTEASVGANRSADSIVRLDLATVRLCGTIGCPGRSSQRAGEVGVGQVGAS